MGLWRADGGHRLLGPSLPSLVGRWPAGSAVSAPVLPHPPLGGSETSSVGWDCKLERGGAVSLLGQVGPPPSSLSYR